MTFSEDLKKFSEKFTELLKQIEIEKSSLLTPLMSTTAEKELKSFIENSLKAINSFSETDKKNREKFSRLLSDYKDAVDNIHFQYEMDIKNLNDITLEKTKKLKVENTEATLELKKKTTEIELEVSWNKNKNDNNIELFETEYHNSIARFDYQLDNSKVAYNETVNYFNNDLKKQLDLENSKHNTELKEYIKETDNIKNRYNDTISKESDELNEYINKFNEIQANQKENKYIETVDLNARIRSLVNEKNQKIVAERIDYSKDQNVNKIEHDMKKRESLLSAQQTSKEFVLNMDKLNNKMVNTKDSYLLKKDKLEKDLQVDILRKVREEEANLRNYINNDSKDSIKKIKKIQKEYEIQRKTEKNKTSAELIKLEKEYKRKTAINNLDKNILDINRNYDLKINNEKENADNKYFQALNNIDENDFTFKTKIHNNNYNINANILKLENSIKTINLDSKYEKENADHQIAIQKLTNKLKKTNIELNTIVDIQEKIINYEELRHEKSVKFLTINNLLEIEKCKTLAEFNTRNYNQNVENAKKVLELSKRNIHMQNSRFSSLANLEIEKNNVLVEKKIIENNSRIELISLKQDKEIELLERKLVYDTETLINKLLTNRFNCELSIISKLVTTFIKLVKELEHTCTFLVDNFFDSITFRPEYVDPVRDLMSNAFTIVYDYYLAIVDTFSNHISEMIERRFSFEKDFKYKSNYEELMVQYNTIFEELYDKKDRLENELTELSIEIDLKNQAIFAIKNQINMARSPSNKSTIGVIKKSISELRKQQKYNEVELINLLNKQNDINKKLNDLVAEINRVREENERKEQEISQIQYNGSISYYLLKRDYNLCFVNMATTYKQKIFSIDEDNVNVTNYEKILVEKRSEILDFNNSLFSKLYNVMNKFSSTAVNNFDKTDKITNNKYEDDTNKLNEKANNEYSIILQKIDNNNRIHDNKLADIQKRISSTNRYYYLMQKNFQNEQSSTSKNSVLEKEKIEQRFYSELYAIRDNQAMIIKDYEDTIARYHNESLAFQNELVSKSNMTKDNLDEDLKKFINQKYEYVKALPERIKAQEINLTKETKEINKNIQKQKVLDRDDYFTLRSEYFKNLAELQNTYNLKLKTYNSERKSKIRQLKRHHSTELRRI
ncbi:MAG: hypothetical protein IJP63_08775 [Acholeplasmatales bacterium]|nr:hypothetical protein [Acholeplasmatales bacterium]